MVSPLSHLAFPPSIVSQAVFRTQTAMEEAARIHSLSHVGQEMASDRGIAAAIKVPHSGLRPGPGWTSRILPVQGRWQTGSDPG